jgi:DNA modification methylase
MGKYITRVEEDFISQCLAEFPEKPEIILDTAAGSGRFEPVLTKLSSWVIATEAKPELMLILAQMGDNVLPTCGRLFRGLRRMYRVPQPSRANLVLC